MKNENKLTIPLRIRIVPFCPQNVLDKHLRLISGDDEKKMEEES